jgi:hypothetical protein
MVPTWVLGFAPSRDREMLIGLVHHRPEGRRTHHNQYRIGGGRVGNPTGLKTERLISWP